MATADVCSALWVAFCDLFLGNSWLFFSKNRLRELCVCSSSLALFDNYSVASNSKRLDTEACLFSLSLDFGPFKYVRFWIKNVIR